MAKLKALRKRFVDSIGPKATHALEDGGVLGVLFGLIITYPPVAALIVLTVFGDGVRPRRLLKRADEVIRVDDVKDQMSYFVGAFVGGTVVGIGFGAVVRVTVAWSGVTVPDLVGILIGV